jgi:hypothetical protein
VGGAIPQEADFREVREAAFDYWQIRFIIGPALDGRFRVDRGL